MSKLRELVDRANILWAPQERPFVSSVPVMGSVIVTMRRALNWMSAKWYVRPILEQQIEFNSAIVQAMNEMCTLLESVSTQLDQEKARVSELDTSLNNQVRESEDMIISIDRGCVSLTKEVARLRHLVNRINGSTPTDLPALREAVHRLEETLNARVIWKRDEDSLL